MNGSELEQADLFRAWLGELRSGKHRQCFGTMDDETGAVCALMVLYKTAGEAFRSIPAGMDESVFRWNDGDRLGFPEIADRIEAFAVRAGVFDIPAALAHADAELAKGELTHA